MQNKFEPAAAVDPEVDRELRDFGVLEPKKTSTHDSPFANWRAESRRRSKLGFAIIGVQIGVLVLVAGACGWGNTAGCVWELPFVVVWTLLMLGWNVAFFWSLSALPAPFEDPRHPSVPGQFASAQSDFPSRDVLFDPSFGRRPPRE